MPLPSNPSWQSNVFAPNTLTGVPRGFQVGSSGALCTKFSVWSNELLLRTATSVGEMLQGFTAPSSQERTEIQLLDLRSLKGQLPIYGRLCLLVCSSFLLGFGLFSKLLELAMCQALF